MTTMEMTSKMLVIEFESTQNQEIRRIPFNYHPDFYIYDWLLYISQRLSIKNYRINKEIIGVSFKEKIKVEEELKEIVKENLNIQETEWNLIKIEGG